MRNLILILKIIYIFLLFHSSAIADSTTATNISAIDTEEVTIIMPLYNRSKTLLQTIASLRAQTFQNWKLIVVDDNSTDDSVAKLKRLMIDEPRIQLIESKVNQGAGPSRNIGISSSNSRYIAFLDSDDLWAPNKLQVQLDFMKRNGSVFTYTEYRIINEENQMSELIKPKSEAKGKELLAENFVVTSSVMLDAQQIGQIEFPDLRTGQDLGLWSKLLERVEKAELVPVELTYLRKWKGSATNNKLKQAKNRWKIIREVEQMPLLTSLYYFAKYASLTSVKYAKALRKKADFSDNCGLWLSALPPLEE